MLVTMLKSMVVNSGKLPLLVMVLTKHNQGQDLVGKNFARITNYAFTIDDVTNSPVC